jgi:acyl-phosphate glycerol 3-phosphate acyltransferase
MGPALTVLGTILIAYLIGAIPFGYLVARSRGVDITKLGSGNIGATNVGRVLGKPLGLLVFVLDFAKGALPTAGARVLFGDEAEYLAVVAGLSAILGHMFPVYLHFKGGKGVATGAGVVFVLVPLPALGGLLVWIAVLTAFRYVSLASLAAAAALIILRLFLASEPFGERHLIVTIFCLVATGLVFARHHANIGRLLYGDENRLQESPAMLTFTKTIHVLALGLWFGSVVTFTFIGASLFDTFIKLTAEAERPFWLPVPAQLEKEPPSKRFYEPLRREQGSRIFGKAVGPLFVPYFGLQTVCGLLAAGTALGWSRSYPTKLHKARTLILLLAVATIAAGWWLDFEVNARRDVRESTSDAVLTNVSWSNARLLAEADAAREDFGRWHTYSLIANFLTLVLVTSAMALAAQLPAGEQSTALSETKVEKPEES